MNQNGSRLGSSLADSKMNSVPTTRLNVAAEMQMRQAVERHGPIGALACWFLTTLGSRDPGFPPYLRTCRPSVRALEDPEPLSAGDASYLEVRLRLFIAAQ